MYSLRGYALLVVGLLATGVASTAMSTPNARTEPELGDIPAGLSGFANRDGDNTQSFAQLNEKMGGRAINGIKGFTLGKSAHGMCAWQC